MTQDATKLREMRGDGAGARNGTAPPDLEPLRRDVGPAKAVLQALSFRNASALYVFAGMFLLFSLWVPDTFLTTATWRSLLNSQAIIALVAIGLLIPLSAGVFDFAVGAEVGIGAILVAWLLAKQGWAPVPAILVTLAAAVVIGLVSGFLVIKLKIDSFIGTLAVSSILAAMIAWISDSQQILGLSTGFQKLGTGELLGVTYPVWIMLVVGIAVWYVLERTPAGRRIYATGGNPDAARLSGVPTARIIQISFIVSASVAVFAGILLSASLGTGDPTLGSAYLLPAFSAAFLGSTQFRGGRFNVWGTVIAVYVLATGVKGLQLAGAPVWIPDLFNGVALIIAVGLSKYQRTSRRASAIRRVISSRGGRRAESPAA
jgi:ribose transport system permease protein